MIYTSLAKQTRGWAIVFALNDDTPHVIPVDELEQHDPENCRCCPHEEEYGVMIHQSFDGREKFESGERKPS